MPTRAWLRPYGGLGLITLILLMVLTSGWAEVTGMAVTDMAKGPTIELSKEAQASIADLDDHPVEDNDAARADRMLEALERIPANERVDMDVDLEALRATPLEERLAKLDILWKVRQQELREAYDATLKVGEQLGERISILEDAEASEASLVNALTDLEDLLSDIDMARDFHTLGGFPLLTSMLLESRPERVREIAAWTIGTAVKNEPDHQLWVLEDGPGSQPSALALLLENASVVTTPTLRSKIVYALSASLSNNGDVQLQFGALRGEAVLSAMYDDDGSDSRVKMKVLTLLSDLLQEAGRGSPAAVLATMPLGSTAVSGGLWCGRVDEALQQASSPSSLEKALEAVASFTPSCRSQFKEFGTKERLDGLAQQCRTKPQEEGVEAGMAEFYGDLTQKIEECAVALR